MSTDVNLSPLQRLQRWIARAEDALLALMLLGLVALSSLQIGRRLVFNEGWIDSETFGRNLVLWIAVLGALAATRERRHVAIDLLGSLPDNRWRRLAGRLAAAIAALGCAAFAWFGWGLLQLEWEIGSELIPHLPSWVAVLVIPLGFALMSLRFAVQMVGPQPSSQYVDESA